MVNPEEYLLLTRRCCECDRHCTIYLWSRTL